MTRLPAMKSRTDEEAGCPDELKIVFGNKNILNCCFTGLFEAYKSGSNNHGNPLVTHIHDIDCPSSGTLHILTAKILPASKVPDLSCQDVQCSETVMLTESHR